MHCILADQQALGVKLELSERTGRWQAIGGVGDARTDTELNAVATVRPVGEPENEISNIRG